MDANTPHDGNQLLFKANIEAIERVDAACAAVLHDAQPPFDVDRITARDGEPTMSWRDGEGRRIWLGRTTMPATRAAALVDAFNPGSQNILLVGFGQGAAAERLLRRLLPHQAVIVVDDASWAVALALHLYDFSAAIQAGQLRFLVGQTAWDDLRKFLEANGGYLAPDRMLAWPWFEPQDVARLTQQLADINKRIAQQRADKLATMQTTPPSQPQTNAIVVSSNIAQPRIRRVARMLAAATQELGRPCEVFALDDPAHVHPIALMESIRRLSPELLVSIESVPETTQLGDTPTLTLLTNHEQTLQRDKIALLPPGSFLGVCNERQREEAIAAGMSANRVLLVEPAACPGIHVQKPLSDCIALMGDVADPAPSAAGLNLATHQRLYKQAGKLIREAIASGTTLDPDAMLTGAEKSLKIRVDDQHVRTGIVDRIRNRLIPSLTRTCCSAALRDAGIAFDIYGEGWNSEEFGQSSVRGVWPTPRDLPRILSKFGLLVIPHLDETVSQAVLDATAAGIIIAVYDTNSENSRLPDNMRLKSAHRFKSPRELVDIVHRFKSSPQEFAAETNAAAAEMPAHDTWTQRLNHMLDDIAAATS